MRRLSAAIAAVVLSVAAGAASVSGYSQDEPALAALPGSPDAFVFDLGGYRFDPLFSPPPAPAGRDDGPGLRLLQFQGVIERSWLQDLRAAGVEPMQYIHPYGYVVWADDAALASVTRTDQVRWAGDFLPDYKVIPQQRGFDAAIRPTMALISRHADESGVRAALEDAGAVVHDISTVNRHFSVVHLDVAGNSYQQLAQIGGVYAVQEIGQDAGPRGEMSNQSIVGAYGPPPSHTIVPGFTDWLIDTGYDGTGVVVSIVDGGIRTSHQDLVGGITPCVSAGGSPTSCTTANDSHGTHVAGAIKGTAAAGTLLDGFLRGQGVAPGASVIQQRYSGFLGGGPGGMIPDGMLIIFSEAALSGGVISNNSWGPRGTPQGYDIPTQQLDIITRDALPDEPGQQSVLPVWSVMNGNGDSGGTCAPSSLGSPDEAKNLFAVGSTRMQTGSGSQQDDIFNLSPNSGHGPACDGRTFPHIVAPGCSTDAPTAGSDTAYGFMCGTSMASPVVSGAISIYIEKFRDQNDGHTPSPALIKAAFTAVAQDLEGYRDADNRVMGHRPDRFQGYGRIDLDAVANHPYDVFSLDQSEVFTASGQEWTQSFEAADPDEPIRIMLAWSDAPGHGLGGTTPAWVNDLDLAVTTSGGTYLGNVIGSDGWSATGGDADEKNNLEGVFLSPAQHGGAITITVAATNIAADALDPHDQGDPAQDFALVCYNCVDGKGGPGPGPDEEADLGISLFAVPNPVELGSDVTVLAQVGNFGPDSASDVGVELVLPPELVFVSTRSALTEKTSAMRGLPEWDCDEDGGTVSCTLPANLPALSLAPALHVIASVDDTAEPGTVTVDGSVSGSEDDPEPDNNTASIEIELVGKPLPPDCIFADGFEEGGDGDCDGNGGGPGPDPDLVIIDDIDFTPNPDFTGGAIKWVDGETCDCDTEPYNFNPYGTDTSVLFYWPLNANGSEGGVSVDGGSSYAVLQSGASIGPDSEFLVVAQGGTDNWSNTSGYLGFRFLDDGITKYGYAHITAGPSGRPFTIHSVAYNNVGDPVTIP